MSWCRRCRRDVHAQCETAGCPYPFYDVVIAKSAIEEAQAKLRAAEFWAGSSKIDQDAVAYCVAAAARVLVVLPQEQYDTTHEAMAELSRLIGDKEASRGSAIPPWLPKAHVPEWLLSAPPPPDIEKMPHMPEYADPPSMSSRTIASLFGWCSCASLGIATVAWALGMPSRAIWLGIIAAVIIAAVGAVFVFRQKEYERG